jgi:hypothetical protein
MKYIAYVHNNNKQTAEDINGSNFVNEWELLINMENLNLDLPL